MDDIFAQLSPEELQQLMGLSTLGDRNNILEEQLAQAEALRNRGGQRHSTALGGLFGALGEGINSLNGTLQGNRLRGQQQANLHEQERLRNLYAQMLAKRWGDGGVGGVSTWRGAPGVTGDLTPPPLVDADQNAASSVAPMLQPQQPQNMDPGALPDSFQVPPDVDPLSIPNLLRRGGKRG